MMRHNRVFISEIAHFGGVGFRQILSFFLRILALVSVSWMTRFVAVQTLKCSPLPTLSLSAMRKKGFSQRGAFSMGFRGDRCGLAIYRKKEGFLVRPDV